ncbi:ATP-binding protein [Guggenheimella bovis]
MVQIIAGETGTGKSKRLISLANEAAKQSTGNILFIDDDNRNIFELDHAVRFINLEEFNIDQPATFYGFICGLLSGDYDIDTIFVDGLDYISSMDHNRLEEIFKTLTEISGKHEVKFVICINTDFEDFSDDIKKALI